MPFSQTNNTAKYLGTVKLSVIFVLFSCFMMGCVSPAKINSWVTSYYEQNETLGIKNSKNVIVVKSSTPATSDENMASTEKDKGSMLPLLFYYTWKQGDFCAVNEYVPLQIFNANILSFANKKGLQKKLTGKKLELTISNIPHLFYYNEKGWMFWLIFHVGQSDISISPTVKPINVKYRLLQGATTLQTGDLSLVSSDSTFHDKSSNSSQKTTNKYLDQYDLSIKKLSEDCVDSLLNRF